MGVVLTTTLIYWVAMKLGLGVGSVSGQGLWLLSEVHVNYWFLFKYPELSSQCSFSSFHPSVWSAKLQIWGRLCQQHALQSCQNAQHGFKWGPSEHCVFLTGWGLSDRNQFLVCLWLPRGRVLWKGGGSSSSSEETSGALGWCGSQLLTFVTDGPCHFLSCSPRVGGGVPSGKPCSALLRVSRPQGSATVRGGGLPGGWGRSAPWCGVASLSVLR